MEIVYKQTILQTINTIIDKALCEKKEIECIKLTKEETELFMNESNDLLYHFRTARMEFPENTNFIRYNGIEIILNT